LQKDHCLGAAKYNQLGGKVKLKLEDLRAAFAVVDNVQASPVQESSQLVRLKRTEADLTLALTGSLWAEARVPTPNEPGKWTAYADRRALKAFLATAKAAEVEIFYKDKLILKAGQRLEVAPHAVVSGYESWTPKTTFVLADEETAALKVMVKYLPEMAGSEHCEAVSFSKDYGSIATDTLCVEAELDAACKQTLFLPAALAKVLAATGGKLGADKSGVGAVLAAGVVYQPLSSELDRYPTDKLRTLVETAAKAPPLFTAKAADLASALAVAAQFLLDKAEAATVTAVNKGLSISVGMTAGSFQRAVAVAGEVKLKDPVQWSVKRILPWLEYVAALKADGEVSYAKLPNAGAFRFSNGTRKSVLICADM
jgi:hypothetical protein